ncbi:Phosphoserine aminotransferase [Aedoeadaptatus ivorii]|uniref:Phosphoserine aminotransferase n=1 Tax=Aedoeadaptatus ivorii TaxID=54006 RepID=A0A448V0C1_9FIRM|nr:3-phosphoserine/phosphohydroxythreonine transaminase [Peptoniphilus ivorii]MDQ0507908.1 phosphoserine aminotransferase [Peptoniphilus ivorii]VEJ34676.1 Phosphoserine aminotransferase [Peptoniphilus ivorii]
MARKRNFSAGPATLPEAVLNRAAAEMTNFKDSGMSVMELSHRSALYESIHDEVKSRLSRLLSLPADREVLLLQGGASLQFAMVPMNLLEPEDRASYLITGSWAKKAYKEAQFFGHPEILASTEAEGFRRIPSFSVEDVPKAARYLYLCTNNTIYGTRIAPETIPEVGVPLVADMSSNILSEPYDMRHFDLVFAGAQKNLGPAGLTVVILKKGLLRKASGALPAILDYRTHMEKGSLYNTPPTYAIYICNLVLAWIEEMGGLDAVAERNRDKVQMLYDCIDESDLFFNDRAREDRSRTNVVFTTGDADIDRAFVDGAAERGLINLKGHRSVGGMRASLYNAMEPEGVAELVTYMKEFEVRNGR